MSRSPALISTALTARDWLERMAIEGIRSVARAARDALKRDSPVVHSSPDDPQPNDRSSWRLRIVAVVLALVAVVAVVAAFAVVGDRSPAAVKVGAIYALTGPDADAGNDIYRGARFAVDYVNDGHDPDSTLALSAGAGLPRLDGAKLKLVKADSQGDRCKSQAAFNRLVTRDRVAAVIGAYESTVTLQAIIAADQRHVPLVNESSTAPSLTERGPRPRLKTCGRTAPDPRPSPWFFRTGPSDTQAAKLFFKFIDDEAKRGATSRVRKVAILHENNDIFGNGGAAVTRRLAERRGVAIREFTYGTVLGASAPLSDSSCILKEYNLVETLLRRVRQIKRYNPDVVFAIGYTPDAITAVQTMKKLGYAPPALLAFGGGFINSSFIRGVRAGNRACGDLPRADPAGIIARASWSSDSLSQRQTARHIAELFLQRYKRRMTAQAAQGFTAILTVAQAINNAGSPDPAKIRAALRTLEVPANATIMPWTGVKFDAHGQNTRAQFVLQQIIGGRYRVVYPPEVSTRRAIWPLAKARK